LEAEVSQSLVTFLFFLRWQAALSLRLRCKEGLVLD